MNRNEHNGVSPQVRRDQIAELLRTDGNCSVGALAARFGVSGMTIRRDLAALAEAGRALRTHGGAAPAERVSFEFRFLERARANREAKRAIAAAAAGRIPSGSSVVLDSGTTTLAVAERLGDGRRLHVITTSLPIASALQFAEYVTLVLLGGMVQRDSPDLVGPLTEENLRDMRADVAMIGADAIDLEGNVYNASLVVGRMLETMAEAAGRRYVVADHTKIGRTALALFGNLRDWDGLITDRGLDEAKRGALEKQGVTVILAPEGKETNS
jgi:DeoR/GlpR family transcriptional regulator of sugar metabolism